MKLTLTDKAIFKLLELSVRESAERPVLRLSVLGGGCSGLKYHMQFQDGHRVDFATDQVRQFTVDGYAGMYHPITESLIRYVTIAVDNKSALFLDGVTISYEDGLNGKGFEFHNPKAKSTCGCGESFGA